MYTLDAREAKGNNELLDKTNYMYEQSLFILFDYVDLHSFIYHLC